MVLYRACLRRLTIATWYETARSWLAAGLLPNDNFTRDVNERFCLISLSRTVRTAGFIRFGDQPSLSANCSGLGTALHGTNRGTGARDLV